MEEIVFKTKSLDERNALIEKLYWSGVKYAYYDENKEGDYIVKYQKPTEQTENIEQNSEQTV